MQQPIIAVDLRGGALENTHPGAICMINDQKEVIYEKGDTSQPIFYRSAMKPIQAIPAFIANVVDEFQLTMEEAALLMASQRGEIYHQEALVNLHKKLGIAEETLVCGESYPLNDAPKAQYIWDHQPKRKLMHNCAGKHLGFLAYAKAKGYDLKTYDKPNHPLQQEIYKHLKSLTEAEESEIIQGMDGCGAPVYGVPLKNMALSYLKFVAPELIPDEETRKAVVQIGEVMQAHPEIIASHQFICTELLKDDNIIAKGGAQGVYCLALKKERISIALKVHSGSEDVWPILVAELLKKINYERTETIENLYRIRTSAILNDSGKPIGETKILL